MKNIASIYMILSFCVYLIIACVVFLICKDICIYIEKRKSTRLRNEYEPLILKHFEYTKNYRNISQIEIKKVKDLLKNRIGFEMFNEIIIEYNDYNKKYDVTQRYMSNFENDIVIVLKKYKRKDNIIKNYIVFLLGEYRLKNYEINSFLIECLTSKSMYLTISALTTIAKLGNANKFIEALRVISKNEKYINDKILNDILDQFSGDIKELKAILSNYNDFSEAIQKSIIEYLKINKNEYFKDMFVELLQSDISKEVRLSIIKYFGVIKSEEAKSIIINILKNKDWEYRAVCATSLMNYNDDDIKNAMLESIKDKNWYVRYNSAVCLLEFDSIEVTNMVKESKDKYAMDILNYAMSIKKKTNKEIEVSSYA